MDADFLADLDDLSDAESGGEEEEDRDGGDADMDKVGVCVGC
jgi:hypothetical protein